MFTRPFFALAFFTGPCFGAGEFVPPEPQPGGRDFDRSLLVNVGSMMGM